MTRAPDDPVLDQLFSILTVAAVSSLTLPLRRHRDDRPPIEKLPVMDSPGAAALDQDDLEALWRMKTWLRNGGYG